MDTQEGGQVDYSLAELGNIHLLYIYIKSKQIQYTSIDKYNKNMSSSVTEHSGGLVHLDFLISLMSPLVLTFLLFSTFPSVSLLLLLVQ